MNSIIKKIVAELVESQTFRRVLISGITGLLVQVGAKVMGSEIPNTADAAAKMADLVIYGLGAYVASPILKQTALNIGLPPAPADPQGVPGDTPAPGDTPKK